MVPLALEICAPLPLSATEDPPTPEAKPTVNKWSIVTLPVRKCAARPLEEDAVRPGPELKFSASTPAPLPDDDPKTPPPEPLEFDAKRAAVLPEFWKDPPCPVVAIPVIALPDATVADTRPVDVTPVKVGLSPVPTFCPCVPATVPNRLVVLLKLAVELALN